MINPLNPNNLFSTLEKPYKAHTTLVESQYKNEWFNAITMQDSKGHTVAVVSFQDSALTIDYYERGSKLYNDVILNPTRKDLRNKLNNHLHYVGVTTWEQKKKLDL